MKTYRNNAIAAITAIFHLKFYSLVNIVGLSAGVLAAIQITLYANNELGSIRLHAQQERSVAGLTTPKAASLCKNATDVKNCAIEQNSWADTFCLQFIEQKIITRDNKATFSLPNAATIAKAFWQH